MKACSHRVSSQNAMLASSALVSFRHLMASATQRGRSVLNLCLRLRRRFIPSVIEPSFGIGRILYCMFEHAYYQRESSEEKTVFRWRLDLGSDCSILCVQHVWRCPTP